MSLTADLFNTSESSSSGGGWASQVLGLFQGLNQILPFNTIGVGTKAKVVAEEERKTDLTKTKDKIILYSAIGLIILVMALVLIPKFKK